MKLENKTQLNIGCGRDIRKGWVNLDAFDHKGVDVVCDMNKGHLPFEDDRFYYIVASHVLEHLWDWESIVSECYRILVPQGTLEIRVPYKLRGLDSIYHVRLFSPSTMDGFCMKKDIQDETVGLQELLDFEKVSVHVNREFGFNWHLQHYIGIKRTFKRGFRKHEIVWLLKTPIVKMKIEAGADR
jgi:SAM-dependent methyltransferase